MSKKSKLLSAISAAALAVGSTQGSLAALTAGDRADSNISGKSVTASRDSDLFIDLMLATGGRLTPGSVRAALPGILAGLDRETAFELPDLMTNIRSMGIGNDVRNAVVETLAGLVAGAPGMAEFPEDQMRVTAEIGMRANGALEPYRVAVKPGDKNCDREITDPNYSWDLDCVSLTPPRKTGSIGEPSTSVESY